MALSHIYFSFVTLDVISVWLLLCYKSFKYCVVSALLIQGWHLSTEIGPFEVWSLQKLSGYAIRCWGYRGSIISHPTLANPTSRCIHPSTHNQETFGNHLTQPSKSIRYTSYANTPELPPQYWVALRLSHQQLHKRDFRCRRNYLRYSRTATIKLW